MRQPLSERRRHAAGAFAVVMSLSAHLSLSLLGAHAGRQEPPLATLEPAPAAVAPSIDVGVEPSTDAPLLPEAIAVEPLWGGGEGQARPDSGSSGRGGDRTGEAAVNLAPRDDGAYRSPALQTHVDRAQVGRRAGGTERRSPEDDQVGAQPMVLTFVALAGGRDGSRRRVELAAAQHVPAADEGGDEGSERARRGTARARDGQGSRGREAARAIDPALAGGVQALRGHEAMPADERGAARDTVDAVQDSSAPAPSLLNASAAGGEPGAGRGGEEADGETGRGGPDGAGSQARALGDGQGAGVVIDPADARRRSYLRHVWQKIDTSWSASDFPRWAALEGRGGFTIVSFVIGEGGSVSGVAVTRTSGVPEFDERMRQAVLRAAPFGPLPRELRAPFRHQHEFVVTNPAVRPPGR